MILKLINVIRKVIVLMKKLYIIVPTFNEADALPETIVQLTKVMSSLIATHKVMTTSKIVFVNDIYNDFRFKVVFF